MSGEIGNECLDALFNNNIYTLIGTVFNQVGIIDNRNILEAFKALYGIPTSSNHWQTHLLYNLRGISLKKTCFESDVCVEGRKGGCKYIVTHTTDILVMSLYAYQIFEE